MPSDERKAVETQLDDLERPPCPLRIENKHPTERIAPKRSSGGRDK